MNNKMIYTKHIAGEFANAKQMCVICGLEICNYEGAMFHGEGSAPQGWAEGPVYISDSKNPTIFLTTEPNDPGDVVIDCKA